MARTAHKKIVRYEDCIEKYMAILKADDVTLIELKKKTGDTNNFVRNMLHYLTFIYPVYEYKADKKIYYGCLDDNCRIKKTLLSGCSL